MRPLNKYLWIFIILIAVPGFTKERLRLVHADSLVQIDHEDHPVTELWGDVQFEQGEAYLKCQHAKWQTQRDFIRAYANVEIFDGKRTLTCSRLEYDGQNRYEKAMGNVHLVQNESELTCDTLFYWQEEERAETAGQSKIINHKENAWLTGKSIQYRHEDGYASVTGHPRFYYVDSTAHDTLMISGNLMEGWQDINRVVITEDVSIAKSEMGGISQFAEFDVDSSILFLSQLPEVIHQNQRMKADSIRIRLENNRFQGVNLVGRAQIIQSDSLKEDQLSGDVIHVYAKNDTIHKVHVIGQATSVYHVSENESDEPGLNTVTGDDITLFFKNDSLHQILVQSQPGYCTGEFAPIIDKPSTISEKENH